MNMQDEFKKIFGNEAIIGPEGDVSKGEFIDETKSCAGKKVAGLIVRHGWVVDGIASIYDDGTVGQFHGNPGGGGKTEVKFDEGDKLIRIEGMKDYRVEGKNVISGLCFFTKKGKKHGPFGSHWNGGKPFVLNVPEDENMIGLCGATNNNGPGGFLTAIGVVLESQNGIIKDALKDIKL